MPRLHKYRNRNACYVLTAISGAVATFQLTTEGERKLAAAGITPGEIFPRALLLDLYRSGDAYTHGSGTDEPEPHAPGQLEMDFANDPDPETAFPACDICRSAMDIHLTLTGPPAELIAQLQCPTCRVLPGAARPDTSIPLALLSRPTLVRLCQLKSVSGKSPGVKQFEGLLQAEFEGKWAALRKTHRPSQQSLLDAPSSNQLNLG